MTEPSGGGTQSPSVGYIPTSDLALTSTPYIPTPDITIGQPVVPPEPDILLVSYGTKLGWGIARSVNVGVDSQYGTTNQADTTIGVTYGTATAHDRVILLRQQQVFAKIDKGYKLPVRPFSELADAHYSIGTQRTFEAIDLHTRLGFERNFVQADASYTTNFGQGAPADIDYTFKYNSVRLTGVRRIPRFIDSTVGYKPNNTINLKPAPYILSSNLTIENMTGGTPVQVGFERTPIQPTGSPFKSIFGKTSAQIDHSQTFAWGYGLNNFVIGGVTTIPSRPEDIIPPEPDPPIVHINYEVYRVVNTVNITVRPSGQFLDFENFSITRDVESFAWTCTFDLLTEQSYNLVRPVGRTLQTIDININGTVFTVFVGKANTSVRASANGTTRVYRCTGWSNLKRLSYPYARRRSFTDSQARTAAQIATNELAGTGFTVDWQTIDWQVPAGVHTYQNKTSLGAILGVVNGVGGVIVPDLSENTFTVRPYYPVSPWNWGDEFTQINRQMNESQFFSIDNDTIPRDNPNGVYVYGQEQGVGVFAVRLGTSGNELLPDVVDRYITANTAGQERGRIEVARNSFIELIPMSTYIDENGIIMPQELIEFTALDGTLWRGMVVQTTVNCSRVGTALTQQITVARFFDG